MDLTAEWGTRSNTGPDNRTTSQTHALELPIKMTCFEIICDNLLLQCTCLDPFLQHVLLNAALRPPFLITMAQWPSEGMPRNYPLLRCHGRLGIGLRLPPSACRLPSANLDSIPSRYCISFGLQPEQATTASSRYDRPFLRGVIMYTIYTYELPVNFHLYISLSLSL